jgi:hypothetical protein
MFVLRRSSVLRVSDASRGRVHDRPASARGAALTLPRAGRLQRLGVRSLTAGSVFAISLTVYGATLLPGVSSFDSAEMQTVPPTLGIAHPTGYPLWTLLGFVWTKLFFFAAPALMMNLLSALLFALGAAIASVVALRLDVRPTFAVVGGLTFAFAGETWARATQAEVHSLHTALVALLLLAWVVAEQTGEPAPALAMILVTSLGLAHHRLMEITGPPLLLWFFVRHLRLLRSWSFLVDAALCVLLPLSVYLYIPIRITEHPRVVEADPSGGSLPVIRGDLFASHEDAFSSASPGRWLRALPHYGHLAVEWLGWAALVFAALGAVALLGKRRRPLLVGLVVIVVTSTWGLANRTDRDLRWLIVPLLVLSLLTAVGLEWAAGRLSACVESRRLPVVAGALGLLIPVAALATNYATYDRSSDTKDAVNGRRILAALAPNAVVWAYWDVRTTLQYLTEAGHVRKDVTVLDHRAYAKYRSISDYTVALDVATDPSLADRPYYLITPFDQDRASLAEKLTLEPVLTIELPYGFGDLGRGRLWRVERS